MSAGPAARDLVQDFVVPVGLQSASFTIAYFQDEPFDGALDPQNITIVEKDPFDENGDGFPQNAFRVDIVDPDQDRFYEDVLYSLYAPTNAVGMQGALDTISLPDDAGLLAALQAYEGQTLRLRIAQIESTQPWINGLDDVQLTVLAPL